MERLTMLERTTATKAEVERRDKLEAARHEAGHLTVAIASGQWGRAWLYETETDDPQKEKTWLGRCESLGRGFTSQIAVAGIVAECWADEPEIEPWEIWHYLYDEIAIPSESDKRHWPADEELETTLAEALATLKEHEAFYQWAVAELVDGEVITDGMARERASGRNH